MAIDPTGWRVYDGTPESRVNITNWINETFEDPGEPLEVITPQGVVVLAPGDKVVRNPDGTYGLAIEETGGLEVLG